MQAKRKPIQYGASLFLSLFFVLSPVFISAEQSPEKTELSAEEHAIIEQIISYLSIPASSPFLNGGPSEYFHLGFIKDGDQNNTYTLGMIKQGENSCYSLFPSLNPALGTNLKQI